MSWQFVETLPWAEPLAFAAPFAGDDMALLYSGRSEANTGHDSYLFLQPVEVIETSDWSALPKLPADGMPLPLWVGYLGYGMRDVNERGAPSPITLPDARLIRYGRLYHFKHDAQNIAHYVIHEASNQPRTSRISSHELRVTNLSSNLTRAEYERIVADTIEQIRDGQFYQANITRKFMGEFNQTPDSFSLFKSLCTASPAPYAAYIRHGDTAILSSSPESFLSIDANGVMTTRPIKGSARRSADAEEDSRIAHALSTSTKNRAENLMIVDLMRNDLARVAKSQSVEVVEQSGLYSYATIHHLVSTIRARKRPDVSAIEAVRACFPAGSMTGAPKIAAMRWCTEQEKLERGVYSGAIGWFGPRETCDLSVVIRTLIIKGNRFEFQVGGGIVADSTPVDEWRETIAKARGICAALGIDEAAFEAL